MRTIFNYLKPLNRQYLPAIIYLGLLLFIGFANIKLGLSHYYIYLAGKLKSDYYAQQAISLAPSSSDAYKIRGILFLQNENYSQSLENFEKAASLRENDYYLWVNVGYLRYKTNDFDSALQAYQKSLKLAPNYAQPNRYMGRFLINTNQLEEGFKYLSKSAEYDSEVYPELMHLARKQFPDNPLEIERSVRINDLKTKKILAKYLIKHHMMTETLRSFLVSEEINEEEKNEFIKYLIQKREFQLSYEIWASVKQPQNNRENNLIFDGGFEQITQNEETGFGWEIHQPNRTSIVSIDDKIHSSGNQAIKIKYDGNFPTTSKALSQLIIVKPNENYRLTFKYNASELISGGLPVIIISDGISNKNIGQSKAINSTNGSWIQQSIDFQTNGMSAISVNLQRLNCQTNPCPIFGNIWLDDFSLTLIGNSFSKSKF